MCGIRAWRGKTAFHEETKGREEHEAVLDKTIFVIFVAFESS
jgi:hypothetical protein